MLDREGRKLGKRNESKPLEAASAASNLLAALSVLGQDVPGEWLGLRPVDLVETASQGWRRDRIPSGPVKTA